MRASPRRARRQGVNLFDVVAEHVKAANAGRPARGGRGLHRGLGEPPAASRCRSMAPRRRCSCPTIATVQGTAIRRARPSPIWPVEHGFVLRRPGGHRRRGHHRRPPVASGQEAPAVRALHRRGGGARATATWSCIASTASAATKAWSRSRSSTRATTACGSTYEGGDKLFVPVENIDVLSRYGSARGGRRPRPAWAASPGSRARPG